jgi:hypothetical protein
MSQERLNSLAILSIEKDMLKNIDFENTLNDFASRNARRNFFHDHSYFSCVFISDVMIRGWTMCYGGCAITFHVSFRLSMRCVLLILFAGVDVLLLLCWCCCFYFFVGVAYVLSVDVVGVVIIKLCLKKLCCIDRIVCNTKILL